jgi:cephalosporin-C deacetylase-like acetyl esterase
MWWAKVMMTLRWFSPLYWAGVFFCVSLAHAGTAAHPGSTPALFDYDTAQPLQIQDRVLTTEDGVAVHDITYASSHDMRVSAYLVVPAGKGPFAGILFGHWGNGSRAEFLPEAVRYAKAGAVSLLPDYPWDRAPPYRKSLGHFDKPELDHEATVQTIVDLRRGLDLLVSRSDVDRKRIAYVGHSFGAQWGAILPVVDPRMRTTVLMAGVPETADLYVRSSNPELVEMREKMPKGQLQNYAQVMSDLDAIRFAPRIEHMPVLMQFGRYEQYFDRAPAEHYALMVKEPKRVLWYDVDHELNDPKAILDRYEWLKQQIGLTGEFRL